MRVVVFMLEFPTWELAKPWSFISGYAFVDALRKNGHDVELVILMYGSSPGGISQSIAKYQGEKFDFAFFWLPHLHYSPTFWRHAKKLSERRAAVLIESLSYSTEEIGRLPHLRFRRREILASVKHCTHVITFDYHDYGDLHGLGYKVFWSPGILPEVPEGLATPADSKTRGLLFSGTVYPGERANLHDQLVATGFLAARDEFSQSPGLVREFEGASHAYTEGRDAPNDRQAAAERLLTVRRNIWYEYLQYLTKHCGVVSLPAYFKAFPGRVFEGILMRSIVLVFDVGHLTRHRRLFENDRHVYYLTTVDRRAIDVLTAALKRVDHRQFMTEEALAQARRYCDAKGAVQEMLRWMSTSGPSSLSAIGPTARGVLRRMGVSLASGNGSIDGLGYEAS